MQCWKGSFRIYSWSGCSVLRKKTIAKICRKIAYKVVEEGGDAPKVTTKIFPEFLGAPILLTKSAKRNRKLAM